MKLGFFFHVSRWELDLWGQPLVDEGGTVTFVTSALGSHLTDVGTRSAKNVIIWQINSDKLICKLYVVTFKKETWQLLWGDIFRRIFI